MGKIRVLNFRSAVSSLDLFRPYESVRLMQIHAIFTSFPADSGNVVAGCISEDTTTISRIFAAPQLLLLPMSQTVGKSEMRITEFSGFDVELKKLNTGNPAPRFAYAISHVPSGSQGNDGLFVVLRLTFKCSGNGPLDRTLLTLPALA